MSDDLSTWTSEEGEGLTIMFRGSITREIIAAILYRMSRRRSKRQIIVSHHQTVFDNWWQIVNKRVAFISGIYHLLSTHLLRSKVTEKKRVILSVVADHEKSDKLKEGNSTFRKWIYHGIWHRPPSSISYMMTNVCQTGNWRWGFGGCFLIETYKYNNKPLSYFSFLFSSSVFHFIYYHFTRWLPLLLLGQKPILPMITINYADEREVVKDRFDLHWWRKMICREIVKVTALKCHRVMELDWSRRRKVEKRSRISSLFTTGLCAVFYRLIKYHIFCPSSPSSSSTLSVFTFPPQFYSAIKTQPYYIFPIAN